MNPVVPDRLALARRNARTAVALGLLALAFFAGFAAKIWLH